MLETSKPNILLLLCVAFITIAVPSSQSGAGAQDIIPLSDDLLTANASLSLSTFHQGSYGYLALTAEIIPGWHINSNRPLDDYLIPTVLEIEAPKGIEVAGILYPEPSLGRLEISEGLMSLYHGRVNFGALLKISGDASAGSYRIAATLHYQGCNNFSCIEPSSVTEEISLEVGRIEDTTELLHPEIFSRPPFVDSEGRPVGADAWREEKDSPGGILEKRGLFFTFLTIFVAGLALNLTPCIYPLIPVTVSYFGGQAGGKTSRIFLLALVYVLGMSITYSMLGVIAASTGSLFGAALQNPWVIVFIAAVLVGLAMSMFGLWEIRMPVFLARRTGTAKQGYLGALFMGLTVGILAAPCIGPFVFGLLTYVGNMGKPVMGFLMFFTLAWGMGVPFLVLGTVSGSISLLPRSGSWMIWVKKIFGFVLITMAIYFARHLIGGRLASAGYGLMALAAGIYLGWLDRSTESGRGFDIIRKLFGITAVAAAVLVIVLPGGPLRPAVEKSGLNWRPFSGTELAEAARAGKPVMIDFSADWCIPCHELDRKTFSDPEVVELGEKIVSLRVDLTRSGEKEKKIKTDFAIKGVPTIIFYDRSGREASDLRITGFVGPEEIRKRLGKLTGGS